MNKAVVLGAGQGQIPIIDLCHRYGWHVTCVSPEGDYPGFAVADETLIADVRDSEIVLDYCKENSIKAILTDQLDAGVATASYVSEALGLRGLSLAASSYFTDKYEMRLAACNAGVASPKIRRVGELEAAFTAAEELGFPMMLKPVDSSASRGVHRVDTLQDIKECFDDSISYSKTGQVVLEEFIVGVEYVVEALTIDGITKNLVIGSREYFEIDNTFIPRSTIFTDAESACSHIELKVKETNSKLIRAFGANFAITHGEYLYNEEEDKVYLVEIAARGGGVFISSDLIPAACGIDANDLLVKSILGVEDKVTIPPLLQGASAYFCYLVPEGIVVSAEGFDEVAKLEGVLRIVTKNIFKGMKTSPIKDKSSRKGPILIRGDSKENCFEVFESARKMISIEVDTGNGIQSAIWR